jgi:hypothetical protein
MNIIILLILAGSLGLIFYFLLKCGNARNKAPFALLLLLLQSFKSIIIKILKIIKKLFSFLYKHAKLIKNLSILFGLCILGLKIYIHYNEIIIILNELLKLLSGLILILNIDNILKLINIFTGAHSNKFYLNHLNTDFKIKEYKPKSNKLETSLFSLEAGEEHLTASSSSALRETESPALNGKEDNGQLNKKGRSKPKLVTEERDNT